jgi:branched-subunit amino acid aminotransferase/4-amino-4-deoxychorismate lyase
MSDSTRYLFDGVKLEAVTWCSTTLHRVAVADSWRVVEGKSTAFERHTDRFMSSARAVAPEVSDSLDRFIDETLSMIPPTGEWFPRWEVVDTGHGHTLQFLHRHAPPRLAEAIVATAESDPRRHPLVKGPDLERLMALRQSVSHLGANEAIIVSPDGHIVEGAYSSVIAWPAGGDEMWVVEGSVERIPSVTEAALVGLARERDISVVEKRFTPHDLEGARVWVVSALHGIRSVTDWVGGPRVREDHDHWQLWQGLLLNR